jgi:hypothetical protein
VLWDFGGQPIPDDLKPRLVLNSNLLAELEPYLNPNEISALQARADVILKRGTFPRPPRDRRAMPWPPL